jgi:lipopolysaccharide transport system ATP-binding protein
LIIDEVLAVGDLEFQKKCIGKMEEVSKQQGRTILFVSHNLKAINDFCNRTIWMESGRIKQNDSTTTVTTNYISSANKVSPQVRNGNEPDVPIFINEVSPVNSDQKEQFIFKLGEKAGLLVGIKNRLWAKHFSLGLGLNTLEKGRILKYSIDFSSIEINRTKQIAIWLPFEELTPGRYTFDLSISNDKNETIDLLTNVGSFEIPAENTHYQNLNYDYGVFRKDLVWHEIN